MTQIFAHYCIFRYLKLTIKHQKLFEQLEWSLVENIRPCFQRLKHVYGHQSNFSKMCLIPCQKFLKSLFLIGFKNGLCHLDPIFMPFPKWGVTFLYLKNWRSYLTFCEFSPIWYGFCKNSSGDHIHAPNFKNRVSFFQKQTKLSTEIVFRANSYG